MQSSPTLIFFFPVFSSTSCYYFFFSLLLLLLLLDFCCHCRRWLSVSFSFTRVALFFCWSLLAHTGTHTDRRGTANNNNNNKNRRALAPCLTPLPRRLSVLTHTHTERQHRTSASVLLCPITLHTQKNLHSFLVRTTTLRPF